MRKIVTAILAAVAIALGVTASAAPAQAAGPVPLSPEHAACLAAMTPPVLNITIGEDGEEIYTGPKVNPYWRSRYISWCWQLEMVREGEMTPEEVVPFSYYG
jgi:hypothetical protein